MERIQSAIQKARQAREGKADPEAVVKDLVAPPVAEPVRPAPNAVVEDAWQQLEGFQPSPFLRDKSRIVTLEPGVLATPFDVMRTRIMKQMKSNGWRRLAITSPGSACGKTTICLNLAFSFARQPDLRILVLEVDLRRPSMARTLGLRKHHNFADVLAGREKAGDNLVRYGMNLAFGTNHGPTRHSAELLQSGKVAEILEKIEATYAPDLVIFDMPPMLAGDDAIGFLHNVDCALLVAAAGSTTIAQVDACERDIAAHTNVLGVTLNKCRYLDKDQAYGYDYYG